MKISNLNKLQNLQVAATKLHSVISSPTVMLTDDKTTVVPQVADAEWNKALPFEAIPGPKPLPLIGNAWRFLKHIGDWYDLDAFQIQEELYKRYGPISTFGSLFGRKTVFVAEPESIETLFRNEGTWPIRIDSPSFSYYRTVERKAMFKDKIGTQVLQGKDWQDFRSKVNPHLMRPNSIAPYVNKIDRIGNNLVERIHYLMSNKNEGDMPENFSLELARYILDCSIMIALNKDAKCLNINTTADSEYLVLYGKIMEAFKLLYIMDILPPIWKYIPIPQWRRYVQILDELSIEVLSWADEAAKNLKHAQTDGVSLLEMLMPVDENMAKTMVLDTLQIGTDITTKNISNALYLLARHPEIQEKLRHELVKVLPNKNSPITADILENASYLKAVLKEVNRVAPVSIGNQRITTKDLILCGYRIPSGTEIITSNLLLSKMDKYFPQADKFIPDRWLRSTKGDLSYKNASQFISLPFGYGPRACVGKRFANLEMEVGIAKVVRNFELSWPQEDAKFQTVFLHYVQDPLNIHMRKIDS